MLYITLLSSDVMLPHAVVMAKIMEARVYANCSAGRVKSDLVAHAKNAELNAPDSQLQTAIPIFPQNHIQVFMGRRRSRGLVHRGAARPDRSSAINIRHHYRR